MPNIHAKPVIDIMVEVTNIKQIDAFNKEMEQLGYEVLGEYGISKRRFFSKGGDNRTHHVHIYEKGNNQISQHLAFRDYMIAHPEESLKYSRLKQALAKKFPTDIFKYMEGKNEYIQGIDKQARMWSRFN
ncbi:glutamate-rich protein grpB [Halalkalibacter okhensis]|uniref:Glutamate-rich protein grpB n=1 Tax=Halalkalibacter okhensis TaxID=333138 RepID=A0A0B0ICA7_9BACI|nr:glutamate-rich protein grpB [Halalkalibacter okhensis]